MYWYGSCVTSNAVQAIVNALFVVKKCVAFAGSLPLNAGGSTRSGAPSADLGELLGSGGGAGTTAPRMSNAMARSLGLVPPRETRTRTLGEHTSSYLLLSGIAASSMGIAISSMPFQQFCASYSCTF